MLCNQFIQDLAQAKKKNLISNPKNMKVKNLLLHYPTGNAADTVGLQ